MDFVFVSRSTCLSDSPFYLTASADVAGSVLIRKETVLVIMSALINRDDNELDYFYAMFCVWVLLPLLVR